MAISGPGARPGKMLILAVLTAAAVSTVDAASIEIEAEHPTRGAPVVVSLSGIDDTAGMTLTVTYRPGSETAETDPVGPFSTDGTVAWSPRVAGLSTLTASGPDGEVASRSVAIRYDRVPGIGVLIFLGAGVLLFGGAMVMLRKALDA